MLQLLSAGAKPALNSTLTTPLAQTNFAGDGPCCSNPQRFGNEINYTDNGNLWTLQGDLEPMGGAWAAANSSGLTLNYQSCPTNSNLSSCGPHSERWRGNESSIDSSIYGDLGGIPVCPPSLCDFPRLGSGSFGLGLNSAFPGAVPSITAVPSGAEVFSIVVDIPYHNYFSSCSPDNNLTGPATGCTYEGSSPYDGATFGFDVEGNYDTVSVAEVCPCNATSNSLQLAAYTSGGGASIIQDLNLTTISYGFTPLHRITIATDRSTFLYMYVDNKLLYSSSKLPIPQNGPSTGALEFALRTSVNDVEPNVATFSDVTVYSTSTITVTGLSSGMSVGVSGPSGFNATASTNSTGDAVVNVSDQPTDLTISVSYNGNVIATYSSNVSAGAVLELKP
jgi:hypothetical protein